MKKILISSVLCLCCTLAIAGDLKKMSGSKNFAKEAATATLVLDWSGATWDNRRLLTEKWEDKYAQYTAEGQAAFIRAFNDAGGKIEIVPVNAGTKYEYNVIIQNVDYFYDAMNVVPGHRHTVWAVLKVIEKATGGAVYEARIVDLNGRRDFAYYDSFLKCMEDLGKLLAKLK